jgi:hypothetical protein
MFLGGNRNQLMLDDLIGGEVIPQFWRMKIESSETVSCCCYATEWYVRYDGSRIESYNEHCVTDIDKQCEMTILQSEGIKKDV